MHRTIVLAGFAALMATTTIPFASPVRAQIGNIFTDPVPRPPANVPRGNQPQPEEEEEVLFLPQGRALPARPAPPPPGQVSAMPGPVQSAPLAPPPGTTVVPQNGPPGVAPPQPNQASLPPGLPPGQRPP